jgi:gas vesicle protein
MNWKAVLIWGVVIGVGVFALWLYKVEPVYSWMCSIGAWADSTIQGLTGNLNVNDLGNQIVEYIKANPIVAITGIIGATGGILALYERSQRIREQELKLKAEEAQQYAQIQTSAVTDNLAYYKEKAESATAELTAIKETNIAQQLETAKSEVQTLTATVTAQKRQMQELMDKLANTPVKVVERYK